MNRFEANSRILLDQGVTAESHICGSSIQLLNMERFTAIFLALSLTRQLERSYAIYKPGYHVRYSERDYNLVDQIEKSYHRERRHHTIILGVARPAGGNCAVRVKKYLDSLELYANIRNDFSDHPELEGSKFLQAGFIAVLNTVDLSKSRTWA